MNLNINTDVPLQLAAPSLVTSKTSDVPQKAPDREADFIVTMPDGSRLPIKDGEFRSVDGKLLFIRRGDRLEIRCPRSKGLYAVEWSPSVPTHDSKSSELSRFSNQEHQPVLTGTHAADPFSSPEAPAPRDPEK
ncbi:MAG: hypothetical protein AAGA96_18010 [Verrucomicrobiota bacterium]